VLEKKKTHAHQRIYTAFAALSITLLLTLWNMFANEDRSKVNTDAALMLTSKSTTDDMPDSCTKSSSEKDLGKECMTVTRTRSS